MMTEFVRQLGTAMVHILFWLAALAVALTVAVMLMAVTEGY